MHNCFTTFAVDFGDTTLNKSNIEYLDKSDPSKGLSIYLGGVKCANQTWRRANKSVNLNLICDNSTYATITDVQGSILGNYDDINIDNVTQESNGICDTNITIKLASRYGCPHWKISNN